MMRIDVKLHERVIVMVNGKPLRYLRPGRHWVWRATAKIELVRLNTELPVAELRPEQLALVPSDELRVIVLDATERALVSRRGRPVAWLGAGERQVWTVDSRDGESLVKIEVIDASAVPAPVLRDDVRAWVPDADYTEVTAPAGTVALRFVDGALDGVLRPGRHAAWTTIRKVAFTVIDLRERLLPINGQEVMTADRVSLRVNVAVLYQVVDAERLATVAREPDDVLYMAVQLAMREAIATRTLDELLADREALGASVVRTVAERAERIGLEVKALGVKDVVLPGEMKALLNRVIEARKEAEANVILRREETAAVRSMANTAKVLADNPMLVRLKELEAYKELAGNVGQVTIVAGGGGVMPKLNLDVR